MGNASSRVNLFDTIIRLQSLYTSSTFDHLSLSNDFYSPTLLPRRFHVISTLRTVVHLEFQAVAQC